MEFIFKYGLVAVMVSLLLAPFGLSVPEEGSILAAGALIQLGAASWPQAYAVTYVGVLCADSLIYCMGRLLGLESRGFLARILGAHARKRIEGFYERFGLWAIVMCRPTPGFRSATFFFAGATGLPYARFLAINALTAAVAVGAYLYLGIKLGEHLDQILDFVKRFQQVFVVLLALVVVFLGWKTFRNSKTRDPIVDAPQEK